MVSWSSGLDRPTGAHVAEERNLDPGGFRQVQGLELGDPGQPGAFHGRLQVGSNVGSLGAAAIKTEAAVIADLGRGAQREQESGCRVLTDPTIWSVSIRGLARPAGSQKSH